MKVLVEEADEPNNLFFPKFSGKVIAETKERYLVRHHLFFKRWCPKDSPMMKCRIITQSPKYESNG